MHWYLFGAPFILILLLGLANMLSEHDRDKAKECMQAGGSVEICYK